MPTRNRNRPFVSGLSLLVLCLINALAAAAETSTIVITSPYAEVDWATTLRLKANLHTHTNQSDGRLSPQEVVDAYHAKGYHILALTDHNRSIWPWTDFDRDPAALNMVAIPGNEFSFGHHRNALFADIDGNPGSDVAASIRLVSEAGGLIQLNHPGRYQLGTAWYVDLIKQHAAVTLFEVYNQGDRYAKDRQTWDAILTRTMPDRPIWGSSNDDTHLAQDLFKNYSIVLAPEQSTEAVKQALSAGRTYFCYEPKGSGEEQAPGISAIAVSDTTITITATRYEKIVWIADGQEVGTGTSLDVSRAQAAGQVTGYVRAVLSGPHGSSYTQPFGIRPAPAAVETTP